MLGAVRLGDHRRNADAHQVKRRKNGGSHLLADADHRHITVFNSCFKQRLFVKIFDHISIFRDIAEFPHLFLIPVDDQKFRACFRKL